MLTCRFVALLAFVLTAVADADERPRVLLIGDSISMGYTPFVQERLADVADVVRVEGNGRDTPYGLEMIDAWLGDGPWDVIHFNWGLHDLCYRDPQPGSPWKRDKVNGKLTSTPEQYASNLHRLVRRMRATGAELIWATTTPVPEGEPGRFAGDAARYNAVANNVMAAHGVPINDLYAVMQGSMLRYATRPGDVHFKEEGSAILGDYVAGAIRGALVRRGSIEIRPAPSPNIIFIMADDLGWGDLGCYRTGGSNAAVPRMETPNIDRLATEGMLFTDAYAGSTVCAPSRCVLMTGLHTGHCRIRSNVRRPLLPEDVTVAEVLRERGYATALVGKWGLGGPDTTGLPTRQGFDLFYGYLDQRHAHNFYPAFLWRGETQETLRNEIPDENRRGPGGAATVRLDYSHDLFALEAARFIDTHADEPFFLYLALTIPHANNEAGGMVDRIPEAFRGQRGMEVPDLGPYGDRDWPDVQKGTASMITRMDADVGRILAQLAALGLDESTLVVFTSDNGPHREGGNDPNFFDSNGPYRGIKRALYEGGIRVPFIARWPGVVPAGSVTDTPIWFADFLPTAAALAGASVATGLDGVDLSPTLRGERQPIDDRVLYWEFTEQKGRQAVRQGTWKAVRQKWNEDPDGPIELYDLELDPGETTDVASEFPEVVERMRVVMRESRTAPE